MYIFKGALAGRGPPAASRATVPLLQKAFYDAFYQIYKGNILLRMFGGTGVALRDLVNDIKMVRQCLGRNPDFN
jgi:hypothetical protein